MLAVRMIEILVYEFTELIQSTGGQLRFSQFAKVA